MGIYRRLVDINGDGRLGRDEFAVALHLIRERGAGRGLPEILPPSLVPPSMRHPVSPTPPSRTEALVGFYSFQFVLITCLTNFVANLAHRP